MAPCLVNIPHGWAAPNHTYYFIRSQVKFIRCDGALSSTKWTLLALIFWPFLASFISQNLPGFNDSCQIILQWSQKKRSMPYGRNDLDWSLFLSCAGWAIRSFMIGIFNIYRILIAGDVSCWRSDWAIFQMSKKIFDSLAAFQ